jgi:hypothetical protein
MLGLKYYFANWVVNMRENENENENENLLSQKIFHTNTLARHTVSSINQSPMESMLLINTLPQSKMVAYKEIYLF